MAILFLLLRPCRLSLLISERICCRCFWFCLFLFVRSVRGATVVGYYPVRGGEEIVGKHAPTFSSLNKKLSSVLAHSSVNVSADFSSRVMLNTSFPANYNCAQTAPLPWLSTKVRDQVCDQLTIHHNSGWGDSTFGECICTHAVMHVNATCDHHKESSVITSLAMHKFWRIISLVWQGQVCHTKTLFSMLPDTTVFKNYLWFNNYDPYRFDG